MTTTTTHPRIWVAGLVAAAIGGLASTLAIAADTDVEQITVRAERATSTQVGRTSSGVPILQYELSYKVASKDLDLATAGGADALKQRVHEAAKSACADLDRLYPGVQADPDCARKAVDEAMPAVDAAIAAARKG